jgi:predicted CopG family antitoxin
MAKKQTSVKLDNEIIKQLKGLKHPGQSFNGVVQELIDGTKKSVSKI